MADFQGPNMSHDWLIEIGSKMVTIYREEKGRKGNKKMTEYTIYTDPTQATGEHVLVVRQCVVCGDNLLGLPGKQYDSAQCEEGHHGSRPGVYYSNGQVIEISEDQ